MPRRVMAFFNFARDFKIVLGHIDVDVEHDVFQHRFHFGRRNEIFVDDLLELEHVLFFVDKDDVAGNELVFEE